MQKIKLQHKPALKPKPGKPINSPVHTEHASPSHNSDEGSPRISRNLSYEEACNVINSSDDHNLSTQISCSSDSSKTSQTVVENYNEFFKLDLEN